MKVLNWPRQGHSLYVPNLPEILDADHSYEGGDAGDVKEKTDHRVKEPDMFNVVLYNDDYTTMEFVVEILMVVFSKELPLATKIMLDVHKKGKGVVGAYTYDIAATKVSQAVKMARDNEFPLKITMEKA